MKTKLWTAAVTIVVLSGLLASAAAFIAWNGIISISASDGHPAWLNSILEFGKTKSIEANSKSTRIADFSSHNPDALGAAHFVNSCAICHGGPGDPIDPVFEGMLPVPPNLQNVVQNWDDKELHWIVFNGLQFAGMPHWPSKDRSDEVWSMVAFLRRLPDMDAQTYLNLARGNAELSERDSQNIWNQGRSNVSRQTCAKCHDTSIAPPTSDAVPRLAGQSESYIARALTEYAAGIRSSGFMEPVAAELNETEIREIASYYASMSSPAPVSSGPLEEDEITDRLKLELGESIALRGISEKSVPACLSCHGPRSSTQYPKLIGQTEYYLKHQLELWRRGGRAESRSGLIMAAHAINLTEEEVSAVAKWFSQDPAPQLGVTTRD